MPLDAFERDINTDKPDIAAAHFAQQNFIMNLYLEKAIEKSTNEIFETRPQVTT